MNGGSNWVTGKLLSDSHDRSPYQVNLVGRRDANQGQQVAEKFYNKSTEKQSLNVLCHYKLAPYLLELGL